MEVIGTAASVLAAAARPRFYRKRVQHKVVPSEAPGMVARGKEEPGRFEVVLLSSGGQAKLRNPCSASWQYTFFLEEGRPLGFLGEFIVSSYWEAGELLTESVIDQLNRWLVGGDSEELQCMGSALKQGILDWTRALPSLHQGSNLLLDKFEEMPWHAWTASATNDLLSQFSEPPPKLPPMIVTRMTQAAEQLGAHLPSMSGKILAPSRQPHETPQGLRSPPEDFERQGMLSGRVQGVRNDVIAGEGLQGQPNIAKPVGLPTEHLNAAHFAVNQPLSYGVSGVGYPTPTFPTPQKGNAHSAGLQDPLSAQPAAGWRHPAVHSTAHSTVSAASISILPSAANGYPPNPWSGPPLPHSVQQPVAQSFMSYPSTLQNPHMSGATAAGYPFALQHMPMPTGPPSSMQQMVEAANFASLANTKSCPQQPSQQQVQQQLLQGSGLLNAQPPQLNGWGAGSESLAQQLAQSACRTAAGGDAAFGGGVPPLHWKSHTGPFAGEQSIHQLVHAASAFAPWPAARAAAVAAAAPQPLVTPPAAISLPIQPFLELLKPGPASMGGCSQHGKDRHHTESSMWGASNVSGLYINPKPAKVGAAPRRVVSGQQHVPPQAQNGCAHPQSPPAGEWVGANHLANAPSWPELLQHSSKSTAADGSRPNDPPQQQQQPVQRQMHHAKNDLVQPTSPPPLGLQSLQQQAQPAGCEQALHSQQNSLSRPSSAQHDSQLTVSDRGQSVQTALGPRESLQQESHPTGGGKALAKQGSVQRKASLQHDSRPGGLGGTHSSQTSLARLQALQQVDQPSGPRPARSLQRPFEGSKLLQRKAPLAIERYALRPDQLMPLEQDSPPTAASAFRRVKAPPPAQSQVLQSNESPSPVGGPPQSPFAGLQPSQHRPRPPSSSKAALNGSEQNSLPGAGAMLHDSPLDAASTAAAKHGYPVGSPAIEPCRPSRLEQLASAGSAFGNQSGFRNGSQHPNRKPHQKKAKRSLGGCLELGALKSEPSLQEKKPSSPPDDRHLADSALQTPMCAGLGLPVSRSNEAQQSGDNQPGHCCVREVEPSSQQDGLMRLQLKRHHHDSRTRPDVFDCRPVAGETHPHSTPSPARPHQDGDDESGPHPIAPCSTPSPPQPQLRLQQPSRNRRDLPISPLESTFQTEVGSSVGGQSKPSRQSHATPAKLQLVSVGTQTDRRGYNTMSKAARKRMRDMSCIPLVSPGFKVTTKTKNEHAHQGPPCKLTSSQKPRSLRCTANHAGQELLRSASTLQCLAGSRHPPTPPDHRPSSATPAPSGSPLTPPHHHSSTLSPMHRPMTARKLETGGYACQQPPATSHHPLGRTNPHIAPTSALQLPAAASHPAAALGDTAMTARVGASSSPPHELKWGVRKRRNTGSGTNHNGSQTGQKAPERAGGGAPHTSPPLDPGCMTPEDGRGSTGDSEYSTIPRGPHDV
ncbi:hypothetical protein WJX74_004347 [Apatococcus lobatus]|uniref:Uncharacterized protein n=1 Tax=Apatococcus lobatus TaxID=904363 RepID=A0AAW1QWB9_9CHLO